MYELVFGYESHLLVPAEGSSCVIGVLAKTWEIGSVSVQARKCCSRKDSHVDKRSVKVSVPCRGHFLYQEADYCPLLSR